METYLLKKEKKEEEGINWKAQRNVHFNNMQIVSIWYCENKGSRGRHHGSP